MKKIILALSVAMIIPSAAAQHFKKPADAIEYRQSAFSLIAYNFGDMGAMLKGKKPFEQSVFNQRAANVAALAQIPHEGFIEGTSTGKTEALAKVWTNKADFDERMQSFQDNANKLAQVASSGDKKAIKQAFGQVGKSCKGCHDNYKKD
ncbi:c-type cytochrome [Shewanella intestini]|uniref:Cytochrome c n=1 Tax=Shewanella intestini TaxID=2017544 RepID=A0ABS5HY20_9GAMM|nr:MULTISPECIES: cytochrome c [Shewanella]MBR9726669.1 cytochrome c [Shewanella intestini]MRG34765.1 cytochrome c [Shewanella sp. XMDDZSB0408]